MYVILPFGVVALSGTLTGESVSGGGFSTIGSDSASGAASLHTAWDFSCSPSCSYSSDYTVVQGVLQNGAVWSNTPLTFGSTTTSAFGWAAPFGLSAYGTDTAAWDGTPSTFTYLISGSSVDTPEPSTALLSLGMLGGLAVLTMQRQRRLAAQNTGSGNRSLVC